MNQTVYLLLCVQTCIYITSLSLYSDVDIRVDILTSGGLLVHKPNDPPDVIEKRLQRFTVVHAQAHRERNEVYQPCLAHLWVVRVCGWTRARMLPVSHARSSANTCMHPCILTPRDAQAIERSFRHCLECSLVMGTWVSSFYSQCLHDVSTAWIYPLPHPRIKSPNPTAGCAWAQASARVVYCK